MYFYAFLLEWIFVHLSFLESAEIRFNLLKLILSTI